jgi:hypothetical protein
MRRCPLTLYVCLLAILGAGASARSWLVPEPCVGNARIGAGRVTFDDQVTVLLDANAIAKARRVGRGECGQLWCAG